MEFTNIMPYTICGVDSTSEFQSVNQTSVDIVWTTFKQLTIYVHNFNFYVLNLNYFSENLCIDRLLTYTQMYIYLKLL